ncbi:flagellar export chaperone FliS [Tepidicella xavieri]|uniref:Flagellar protein FliS n=1 Tax=Tepidicella xavieri TaxID=360241 RepID=A0A4R6UEV2_9BURK|nr:flagellar export chaperone FliS [Tepidicella xavieri]TDQ45340.1 flagellar protein FliS [Tepidicella xavieri]
MMNRPFSAGMSAYRDVDIHTRASTMDQHELVAMMYEGALESVARARGALQQGDIETKVLEIQRAVRILQEGLRTSLDLENGGELAANLANLYDYCIVRLTQANGHNDEAALAEVARLIKPIAEAWRQMRAPLDKGAAPNAAPTPSPSAADPAPSATTRRMGHVYSAAVALASA